MLCKELKEKYGALMTPKDAAAELRQHPMHVRKLCRDGKLPAVLIGNRWRINTERFAEMFEGSPDTM